MIRTAILGASGYVGGELLRLCAGHPELRPVRLFGDSQAGCGARRGPPHLALAYPGLGYRARSTPAALGRRRAGLRRAAARPIAEDRGGDPRRAASRSSISARISGSTTPAPTSAGTASRTPRPSCSAASSTASPSSHRGRDRRREGGRRGGLLSDRGDPRAEAAGRCGLIEPGQRSSSTPPRASAAPAGRSRKRRHFNTRRREA